jgi:transaldolase
MSGRIRRSIELGSEFWNDSCDARELGEAVAVGAVGATSNPVIVSQVVDGDRARWLAVLDRLAEGMPEATEIELAWALVERIAVAGAALLAPAHAASGGRNGHLCVQVNPQLYRSSGRMVEHGRHLAGLAPNIAVKIPATRTGLAAMEELTSAGIRVNATVCFTVSQAVACAQAFERGLERAASSGQDAARLRPVVTLMVGRLDDHLRRVFDRDGVDIDPGFLHWAGIAVLKRARAIFRECGYRSMLLAAAYRHVLHWSELVGPGVILSMPYKWWKQFDAADHEPEPRLERPVPPAIVDALRRRFGDFRAAYDEDGLAPADFASYGASVHTLQQFLAGHEALVAQVRQHIL